MSLLMLVLIYILSSYFIYWLTGLLLIQLDKDERKSVKAFFIYAPFMMWVELLVLILTIVRIRAFKPDNIHLPFTDYLFGKDIE